MTAPELTPEDYATILAALNAQGYANTETFAKLDLARPCALPSWVLDAEPVGTVEAREQGYSDGWAEGHDEGVDDERDAWRRALADLHAAAIDEDQADDEADDVLDHLLDSIDQLRRQGPS